MFNVVVDEQENGMYLYNSYKGLDSIKEVAPAAREKVKDYLSGRKVDESDDPILNELIENRFMVPELYDERADREQLFYEYTMEDTLDITVHTTDACNFRCKYCALDFKTNVISKDVQDRIIKLIARNVNKYSRVHIDWFGGEPLIGIDAIEYISEKVIDICRKAKKPYTGSITTNGYLLTKENVEKLIKSRVTNYTITVDGLKETHDNQRIYMDGGPTWDRIIGNLEGIRDNVKNRYISVVIRGNFTKEMLKDLPEFYNLLNDKFGKDPRFSFFVRPAGDWGGERVKLIADHLMPYSQMAEVYNYLAENQKDLKCIINLYNIHTCGAMCRSNKKNRYVITSYGKVQKCETCRPEHEIGEISKDGRLDTDKHLEAVWTVGFRRNKREQCDECPLSCSCLWGNCPKIGVLNPKDKNCGYITEYKELIKLAAKTYDVETLGAEA